MHSILSLASTLARAGLAIFADVALFPGGESSILSPILTALLLPDAGGCEALRRPSPLVGRQPEGPLAGGARVRRRRNRQVDREDHQHHPCVARVGAPPAVRPSDGRRVSVRAALRTD